MTARALVVLFLVGFFGAAIVKAAVTGDGVTVTINNYAR